MDKPADPTCFVIMIDDQIFTELAAESAGAQESARRLAPTRVTLKCELVIRKGAHFVAESHALNLTRPVYEAQVEPHGAGNPP